MIEELLRLSSVGVNIAGHQLVRDVNLSVAVGEQLALVGPNGAGKTTILRAIAGLQRGYSGSVVLSGQEVSVLSAKAISKQVAFVPQRLGDLPRFTVREFINLSGSARREQAVRLVSHLINKYLPDLSAGELQRVLLAGALAQGAKLLLLDEPTSNLDPLGQAEVEGLLRELNRSLGSEQYQEAETHSGISIITVTHDISLAVRFSTRLIMMSSGTITWSGSSSDPDLLGGLEESYGSRFAKFDNPEGGAPFIVAQPSAEVAR